MNKLCNRLFHNFHRSLPTIEEIEAELGKEGDAGQGRKKM